MGREDILQRIRTALGDRRRSQAELAELGERLSVRPPGPAVHLDGEPRARFIAKATANLFTVEHIAALPMLVSSVAALLPASQTAPDISVAPALADLDWPAGWKINRGPGRPIEQLSVTLALAGIAETGSIVFASGPDSPTGLNFLPDLHVAVLHAHDILTHPEDVWRRMDTSPAHWPRAVNVISGPSRTADVGGVIVRPAHGPKQVHLVIVDD